MATNAWLELPVEGGGTGVTSLNGLTGILSLLGGTGVTITPSGSSITIAVSGDFANTELSNLGTTAINADLLPGITNTINVGSTTQSFSNMFSNNYKIVDSITGTTVLGILTQYGASNPYIQLDAQQTGYGLVLSASGGGDVTVESGSGNLNLEGKLSIGLYSGGAISIGATDNINMSGLDLSASTALVLDASENLISSVTTLAELSYVHGVTSAIQTQLNAKQPTLTTGNLTDAGTDGISVSGGTGAVIGAGTSIAQAAASASQNGYLSSTNFSTFNSKLTSSLASGDIFVGNGSAVATAVAMSGDATLANTGALTLATVNTNTGSFGSTTAIPNITVNGKGLITAASTSAVVAPAGTLSGTTLNSTVVTSSLTSVGTIGTGTWAGTVIAVAHGGTGSTTALTQYGVKYASSTTVEATTAAGGVGQVLTANSGSAPTWQAPATGSYATCYFSNASSWSQTGASFAAPTNSGGNSLSFRKSSGISVSAAASSGCGITFTPASTTAVYQVIVKFGFVPGLNATSSFQLFDGTTQVDAGATTPTATTQPANFVILSGIYAPASSSAQTLSIQTATSAGTATIQAIGTLTNSVEWHLMRIF